VADADEVVVDIAEVVAFVELESWELGDLLDGAGEQVALGGDHLAHRDELAFEREQPLELALGGVGEHLGFELVDLVVHVGDQREEAVGERVEDPVEQELLTVQHAAVELIALVVERRQGVAVDRDEVVAGDVHVDFAEWLGSSSRWRHAP
jgi:hypothetical protein